MPYGRLSVVSLSAAALLGFGVSAGGCEDRTRTYHRSVEREPVPLHAPADAQRQPAPQAQPVQQQPQQQQPQQPQPQQPQPQPQPEADRPQPLPEPDPQREPDDPLF